MPLPGWPLTTPHVTANKLDGKPLNRIRVNRAVELIDHGGKFPGG